MTTMFGGGGNGAGGDGGLGERGRKASGGRRQEGWIQRPSDDFVMSGCLATSLVLSSLVVETGDNCSTRACGIPSRASRGTDGGYGVSRGKILKRKIKY